MHMSIDLTKNFPKFGVRSRNCSSFKSLLNIHSHKASNTLQSSIFSVNQR